MSEGALLQDAVGRVFADFYDNAKLNVARRAGWSEELWNAIEETGISLISVPESSGGSGGTLVDAAEVLRLAGKFCVAAPLAETAVLGGWALAAAGLPVPSGPLAFCVATQDFSLARSPTGFRVSGRVDRVPCARHAVAAVLVLPDAEGMRVVYAPRDTYQVRPHRNLAGEARDDVVFEAADVDPDRVRTVPGVTVEQAQLRGALARAVQMAGALERILELTVAYTKQRSQFGRPIIKFQAVQQELARLAGEAAIARASAMSAAARLMADRAALWPVAAAKIKAGEAAHAGAAIAHQLHGAIGVTDEYLLHHSTLRLSAWRAEYGSEAYWAERLGGTAFEDGATRVWSRMTDSG